MPFLMLDRAYACPDDRDLSLQLLLNIIERAIGLRFFCFVFVFTSLFLFVILFSLFFDPVVLSTVMDAESGKIFIICLLYILHSVS